MVKRTSIRTIFIIINIIWVALVWWLCTMPPSAIPETGFEIPHFDKVVHIGLFGGVSFFLNLLFLSVNKRFHIGKQILAISIAILYGVSIEIVQPIYFQRGFETWDIIADSLGAFLGVAVSTILTTKLNIIYDSNNDTFNRRKADY